MSNLAAQTGASLFTQVHTTWVYNKTEHLHPAELTASPWFTHLVAEAPADAEYRDLYGEGWRLVHTERAFVRWRFDRALLSGMRKGVGIGRLGEVLSVQEEDVLWVLQRIGWEPVDVDTGTTDRR